MYVAASTHCFAEKNFAEACHLIADLEYDKVELWMSEQSEQLRPDKVAADPERYFAHVRETTRLTPIAIALAEDTTPETLSGVCRFAKLLRIAQVTVPTSPIGTPFNSEVDRLRAFQQIGGQSSVRISIKTKTGCLTEDPHTAVELCQAVRGLGLTLDPSYYLCGPNRGQPYDMVYPYTFHVHLRDTSPNHVQVQTGLGEIDYARLISQLHKVEYHLALTVDLLPEHTDPETRPLEMRKLRMLLETLL